MKYILYTIVDMVAEDTAPVFCAKNDNVALRQFNMLMKDAPDVDKDNYKLFKVGQMDSEIYPPEIDTYGKGIEVVPSINLVLEENNA